VWGVMDELSHRSEDLIYFAEGCLMTGGVRFIFFDKETILDIHDWIMRFIRYAPEIRERAKAVIEAIKHPFNALHVRRTDHKTEFEEVTKILVAGVEIKQGFEVNKNALLCIW